MVVLGGVLATFVQRLLVDSMALGSAKAQWRGVITVINVFC